MARAFEPFTEYITYLAEGKFDGYFNSAQPEDLVTDLDLKLSFQPMLLLHDLGKSKNEERIKQLFIPDTVFVSFCIIFLVDDQFKFHLVQPSICQLWFWKDSPYTGGAPPLLGFLYFM